MFTSFGRRGSPEQAPGRDLSEEVRQLLPYRFEAVGEALAAAADTGPPCAVAGRDVARDGAALGEALHGLRVTFELVLGTEPDFASLEVLSVAWSEATLEFLHGLSCEDPLTGMASRPHLTARLDDLYRAAALSGEPVARSHCLVVLELRGPGRPSTSAGDVELTRALHLVQLTEAARAVFPGEETIARLSADRAAIVVRRTPQLGHSVAALREVVDGLDLGTTAVRVWVEGLPQTAGSAVCLVDELAR